MAETVPVIGTPEKYRALIKKLEQQLIAALPRTITPDRFIQLALVTGAKTPHFFDCTRGSIAQCVMQGAELGLPIGPTLGMFFFIPRKNKNLKGEDEQDVYECTGMVGYKGWAELARRSGEIAYADADVVYDCDKVEVTRGLYPNLVHVPNYDDDARTGPKAEEHVTGAYAVIGLKGVDRPMFVYLPRKEILKRKARAAGAASTFSPWTTDFAAMCRKTAILALLKGGLVPLSTDVRRALEIDPDADETPPAPEVPEEVLGKTTPTSGMDRVRRAVGTQKGSPLDPHEAQPPEEDEDARVPVKNAPNANEEE